jgi:DNA polymerase (family 10)
MAIEETSPASSPDLSGDCTQSFPTPKVNLVRQCDVKGVLHSHTRGDDGAHSLTAMVRTANEIGLVYLGVSDHVRISNGTNGLSADGIARQRDEMLDLMEMFPGFDILQGVEVDVDADGNLPVADELLAEIDYEIVSLADGKELTPAQETERALRAIRHPLVSIMSKPVGDYMLRRPPVPMDMPAVIEAAAESRTAVEIDANPHSLQLDWTCCHQAQELGVFMAINPNAHRAARLVDYRHGVELARDAGICCRSLLNTMSADELREYFAGSR